MDQPRALFEHLIDRRGVGGAHVLIRKRLLGNRQIARTGRYDEDILLVFEGDRADFPTEKVILKSEFGQTNPLTVSFTEKVQPKTLFCTFHHAGSKINNLFGDKSDELILTAAFKSVKVEILPV